MAVSKIWPVRYSLERVIEYAVDSTKTEGRPYSEKQIQALADVLAYAQDEEKTDRAVYVDGINCDPSAAPDQFLAIKIHYGKPDGIQAYHGYLSFKEDITPELAQEVGLEFARRVWGDRFQVVVTTHLNTERLHCHFVINSVSFVDGKMLHGEEKSWIIFRHIADEVCREYGLLDIPSRNYSKQASTYYRKEKAGIPTRYSVVREILDEVIGKSRALSELKYNLKQMGILFQDNRKYWTVIPKGYNKPIRLYRLGDEYTNEAILRRLHENFQKCRFLQPFQPETIVVRPFGLPTREDKIKKVGGLYGLYLYYCYKLGYLPKYKTINPASLHYAFREDWLKLDRIAEQTRLLGREHISTTEQLFSYRAKVESEINTLTADRKVLRNLLRRKIDEKELSEAKEQISSISKKLKTLRKEIKLCDGIAERSDSIRVNLELALADEQKSKAKEAKRNEQQR